MKNTYEFIFTIALALIIQNGIKAQGWVISDSDNSVTFIKGEWIKSIESGEEGESTTLFNTAKGTMVMIDDNNMMYAEGTGDDFCKAMKDFMSGMTAQMSEEQKQYMQALINEQKAKSAPKVTVSKEPGETIAGYRTTKYSISVNGELFEEKWMTNDQRLSSLIKAYQDTQKLISKITVCSLPEGWAVNSTPELTETYENVDRSGLELKSISYELGDAGTGTEVMAVDQEDIDNSEFQAPEDYEKVSFREFLEMSEM